MIILFLLVISLTLDQRHLATKTRVRLSRDYDKDRIFLNEEESDINKRVATCLEEVSLSFVDFAKWQLSLWPTSFA